MMDEYSLVDVEGYVLLNFASSNFKREYDWTMKKMLLPHEKDRLLLAVRRLIEGYCARNQIAASRGATFLEQLHGEWLLSDNVGLAAERLWTSAKALSVGDGTNPEFCFIYSQLLREDAASLARSCAIIARALNKNLVGGRAQAVHFPSNGECWRGGGFDEQYRNFFEIDKKFRVPCFLATSTKKSVTNAFMTRAQDAGYPVVQWRVLLDKRADPEGENSSDHRCKHANLLRATHVPGEEEYLFSAFSVFTVVEVDWSPNPTFARPHYITIQAAIDNSKEPEDLPLAPWN